jgi:hypothetical protein
VSPRAGRAFGHATSGRLLLKASQIDTPRADSQANSLAIVRGCAAGGGKAGDKVSPIRTTFPFTSQPRYLAWRRVPRDATSSRRLCLFTGDDCSPAASCGCSRDWQRRALSLCSSSMQAFRAPSLVSQHHQRIQSRCRATWKIRCEYRDKNQNCRDSDVGGRIQRRHIEQEAGEDS